MNKINVVPYYLWISFSIVFSLLILLFLWSIFGYIPITIKGRGVIISRTGLYNIQVRVPGTVTDLRVQPGSLIKKGEVLMKIYDPQTELKYEDTKAKVNVLKEQIEHLRKQITKEAVEEKKGIKTKMAAVQFTLLQIQDDIDFQEKDIKKSRELLNEGLISASVFHALEYRLMQSKIDLEEKMGELAVLNSDLNKEYRPQELRNREQELLNELEQFNLLQSMMNEKVVYSEQDGKVIEVLVNPGDLVKQGSTLVWLENKLLDEGSYLIYGYFPVNMGKRIHLGTPVKMTIEAVNPNEYGSILGKVVELSSFAVSQENIFTKIHNRSLIDYLTDKQNAVIQAIIEPEYDPMDPKRILWSSGKIPPIKVSSGMVGDLEATVEKIRPIYYLLPIPSLKEQN